MNEINQELVKQVSELVDLAKVGIIKSAEILQQQAPDLINQLITWKIYKEAIGFGISFFVLISALLLVKYWKKLSKFSWMNFEGDNPLPVFGWMYMLGGVGYSVITCIIHATQLVYIQVAPKVYLLSVLKNML